MNVFVVYRRLYRIGRHFAVLLGRSDESWVPWRGLHYWFADLLFLLLDILFIAELHSLLTFLIGMRGRRLTEEEVAIAHAYFGDQIDTTKVRLWDGLGGSLSRRVHAFVTFNTINCTKKMSKAILVHELVHVWQYQKFGSLYIPRALTAQWSAVGYDYGGLQALYHDMLEGGRFIDYNFEQQGDIFQHYYSLQQESALPANAMHIAVYAYFAEQVKVWSKS